MSSLWLFYRCHTIHCGFFIASQFQLVFSLHSYTSLAEDSNLREFNALIDLRILCTEPIKQGTPIYELYYSEQNGDAMVKVWAGIHKRS